MVLGGVNFIVIAIIFPKTIRPKDRFPLSSAHLSFDLNATPLEELSQGLFYYLTLSMHAAFGLYGIKL
jgi:hypothetical protein